MDTKARKNFTEIKYDLETCIEILDSDVELAKNMKTSDVYVWFGLKEVRDLAVNALEYLNKKIDELGEEV